jgi:hypothetical protein
MPARLKKATKGRRTNHVNTKIRIRQLHNIILKWREFVRRNVGTHIQDNGVTPHKTHISFTYFLFSATESLHSEAL